MELPLTVCNGSKSCWSVAWFELSFRNTSHCSSPWEGKGSLLFAGFLLKQWAFCFSSILSLLQQCSNAGGEKRAVSVPEIFTLKNKKKQTNIASWCWSSASTGKEWQCLPFFLHCAEPFNHAIIGGVFIFQVVLGLIPNSLSASQLLCYLERCGFAFRTCLVSLTVVNWHLMLLCVFWDQAWCILTSQQWGQSCILCMHGVYV